MRRDETFRGKRAVRRERLLLTRGGSRVSPVAGLPRLPEPLPPGRSHERDGDLDGVSVTKRLALVLRRLGRLANGHSRLADGAAGFFSPPEGRLKAAGLVRVLTRQFRSGVSTPGALVGPGKTKRKKT